MTAPGGLRGRAERLLQEPAPNLAEILDLVSERLRAVEAMFRENVASPVGIVREIGDFVAEGGGKRVRPTLHLLAADVAGYRGPHDVLLGCVLEYIHTATLIHDDISDRSEKRRGRASAHEHFGIGKSLIAADYLMTTAFKLIADYGVDFISTVNAACMNMAIGEIHDLRHTGNSAVTEEEYYDIIARKTGALFEAGVKVGVMAAGADAKDVASFGRYGREVGLAFQIVDDTLDVSASAKRLGKPVGKDLREGKVTMPTIFAMAHASRSDRAFLRHLIEVGGRETSDADLRRAVKIIRATGAEAYCRERARGHTRRAKAALKRVPPSRAKAELLDFADDLAERGA